MTDRPPASDRAAIVAPAAAAQPGDSPRAGPVCVVDDDDSVRESLRILLEAMGFSVATYTSGSDLLASDSHRAAGCVILDQHMPGMDGIATLEALRQSGFDTPTILITGRLDPTITARAATLNTVAVLEKPFPATRLVELVRASGRQPP